MREAAGSANELDRRTSALRGATAEASALGGEGGKASMPKLGASKSVALAILDRYVRDAGAELGDSLEAILLTGSLATGCYVPGPGDIDQITILRDSASPCDLARAVRCAKGAMRTHSRTVNLAPVVYRRRELERPWRTEWDLSPGTKHLVCVPEELLRLHNHGVVLFGEAFYAEDLPCPTFAEMVAYGERQRRWDRLARAEEPSLDLLRRPLIALRLAVQVILSRAIWHYYYATGKMCFNKHLIGDHLRGDLPTYSFLGCVDLATRVRLARFVASAEEHWRLDEGCREYLQWERDHAVADIPCDP